MSERDAIREALTEDAAMRREHQAHLQALRERRLKAVKGERRMTEYVVLTKTSDSGEWSEFDKVNAVSAEAAIRAALGGHAANGEYVAVPARSWKPVSVKVETALKFS